MLVVQPIESEDIDRVAQERLARENAARALAIDPSVGLAHVAYAQIDRVYWRWESADRAYARAVELSPNDSQVLSQYGWFKACAGEFDEGIELTQRAIDVDPNGVAPHLLAGVALAYAGQTEAAAAELQTAVAVAPRFAATHLWLAHVQAVLGNIGEARDALASAEEFMVDNPLAVSALMYAYSQIGDTNEVTRLGVEFDRVASGREIGAGNELLAHLARRDEEQALHWLRTAVEKVESREPDEGFFNLMMVKADIYSDPILEQSPFSELRARLGSL